MRLVEKGNFKATPRVTPSANGPFLNKHQIKANFQTVSITATVNVAVVNNVADYGQTALPVAH